MAQVKKYVHSSIVQLDEQTVLRTIENHIINYFNSHEFQSQSTLLDAMHIVMRKVMYYLSSYIELYSKFVNNEPLNENIQPTHITYHS